MSHPLNQIDRNLNNWKSCAFILRLQHPPHPCPHVWQCRHKSRPLYSTLDVFGWRGTEELDCKLDSDETMTMPCMSSDEKKKRLLTKCIHEGVIREHLDNGMSGQAEAPGHTAYCGEEVVHG